MVTYTREQVKKAIESAKAGIAAMELQLVVMQNEQKVLEELHSKMK